MRHIYVDHLSKSTNFAELDEHQNKGLYSLKYLI